MVFDTQSDRGIRMVSDRIATSDLKRRLLADATYASQSEHCEAYRRLFTGDQFDAIEYRSLGDDGCELQP